MPNLTKVSYQIQHNSWIKYMKDQMLLHVTKQEEMSFANVLPPTCQVKLVPQIVLKKQKRQKFPLITLNVFALEQRTVLNSQMQMHVTPVVLIIILKKLAKQNVTLPNSNLYWMMIHAKNVEKKNTLKQIPKNVQLVEKIKLETQLVRIVNVQRVPISM